VRAIASTSPARFTAQQSRTQMYLVSS